MKYAIIFFSLTSCAHSHHCDTRPFVEKMESVIYDESINDKKKLDELAVWLDHVRIICYREVWK